MVDMSIEEALSAARRRPNPKISAQAMSRVMHSIYRKKQRDMSIVEIACGVLGLSIPANPYELPDDMDIEDFAGVNRRTSQASNYLYKAYGIQAVPFNLEYLKYIQNGPLTEEQAYLSIPRPNAGKVGIHLSVDGERDLLVKVRRRKDINQALSYVISSRAKMQDAAKRKLLCVEDYSQLKDEISIAYGGVISIAFNGNDK